MHFILLGFRVKENVCNGKSNFLPGQNFSNFFFSYTVVSHSHASISASLLLQFIYLSKIKLAPTEL